MKKTLILIFVAFVLVGCGSGEKETSSTTEEVSTTKEAATSEQVSTTKQVDESEKTITTVCSIDTPFQDYSTIKQTYISKYDIVKKITFEGMIEFSSKEERDKAMQEFNANIEAANSFEGITPHFEEVGDTKIKDIAEYDLMKTSIQTLRQLGLLNAKDTDKVAFVSLQKTVSAFEAQGFTCTVE